jgi:hypothetical protein
MRLSALPSSRSAHTDHFVTESPVYPALLSLRDYSSALSAIAAESAWQAQTHVTNFQHWLLLAAVMGAGRYGAGYGVATHATGYCLQTAYQAENTRHHWNFRTRKVTLTDFTASP